MPGSAFARTATIVLAPILAPVFVLVLVLVLVLETVFEIPIDERISNQRQRQKTGTLFSDSDSRQ